jgi:hypothetical protein
MLEKLGEFKIHKHTQSLLYILLECIQNNQMVMKLRGSENSCATDCLTACQERPNSTDIQVILVQRCHEQRCFTSTLTDFWDRVNKNSQDPELTLFSLTTGDILKFQDIGHFN